MFKRVFGVVFSLLILTILSSPRMDHNNQTESCDTVNNPAAEYCNNLMGYEYEIISLSDGSQEGVCKMPTGQVCPQWDFYAGKCGASFSYCQQTGKNLEIRSDGKDPYAREYAVCVDHQGKEIGSVSELTQIGVVSINEDHLPGTENAFPVPDQEFSKAAPPSFDWRNYDSYNWITPVKNQSTRCGSCWAFAATAFTEAYYNIAAQNPYLDMDLSEQYLVSSCLEGFDCVGGLAHLALNYILNYGIPDEACYPYLAENSLCNLRCSDYQSRLITIPYVFHVSAGNYTNAFIKETVSSMGPVTMAIGMGPNFDGYWDGDIYRCNNDLGSGGIDGSNHAVMVVGYNDPGGYWIIKNSYGSDWNGDGYFKLGYNECNDIGYGWISYTINGLPDYEGEKCYIPLVINSSITTTNAIRNGDFEAGRDGSWTESSSHNFDLVLHKNEVEVFSSLYTPHGGDWMVWLGGENNETSRISQSIKISAAQPYLRLWYWEHSADDCGTYASPTNTDIFNIKINNTIFRTGKVCEGNNTAGWVEYMENLSIYAGQTVTLTFEIITNDAGISNFFLDDIRMSSTPLTADSKTQNPETWKETGHGIIPAR